MIVYAKFEVSLHGLAANAAQIDQLRKLLEAVIRVIPAAIGAKNKERGDYSGDVEVELSESAGRDEKTDAGWSSGVARGAAGNAEQLEEVIHAARELVAGADDPNCGHISTVRLQRACRAISISGEVRTQLLPLAERLEAAAALVQDGDCEALFAIAQEIRELGVP